MSTDRVRLPWRTESVEFFVILVSLCRLDTVERAFSKDLPCLVMLSAFFIAGAEGEVEAKGGHVRVKQEDSPRQALRDQRVNRIAGAGQFPGDKMSLECSELQLTFSLLCCG